MNHYLIEAIVLRMAFNYILFRNIYIFSHFSNTVFSHIELFFVKKMY